MSEPRKESRLIEAETQSVKCSQCNLPSVEIRAGALLVVRNRHHGHTHENVFSLAWIKQLIERAESPVLIETGAQ